MPDSFVDHLHEVPDETVLYRRISWDLNRGRDSCPPGGTPSLNGNSFGDYSAERAQEYGYPSPCMSVGVDTILHGLGFEPMKVLEDFDGYGLASIKAGDLRSLRRASGDACPQGIMLSPTEAEPWHAVVFNLAGGSRPASVKRAIALVASWVVPLVNT